MTEMSINKNTGCKRTVCRFKRGLAKKRGGRVFERGWSPLQTIMYQLCLKFINSVTSSFLN